MPIPAVIGAGAGLMNTLLQSGLNKGTMADQAQYNLDLMRQSQKGQYLYGEAAANNADKRQRALYEDYMSYKAQVRQLEEAGLNKALMYGGGGSGGAMPTGQNGGGASASAGSVSALGVNPEQIGGILAQAEVNKSIAEKNYADAASTRGEKGTVGAAQINALAKDASLKTAQEVGLQIENGQKKALNDAQIKLIQSQSNALMQNVQNEIMKINLGLQQFRLEQQRFAEQKRQYNLSRSDANRKWSSEFMFERKKFNTQINQAMKTFETNIETTISENKKGRRQQIINGVMHTAGSIVEGLILGTMFKGAGGALKVGMAMPNFGKYAGTPDMYGRDWL